ncbi:MAG TPA: 50S ribosomal protein L33 [bacterium]|nr:50S ribosomal protein L33 [bacterium]HPT30176.1 50S ribosomal protein L33 [bacterium]
MSQDNMIKLECTECKTVNYNSHKNKKLLKDRLEMNKYCPKCRKHTLHKETK